MLANNIATAAILTNLNARTARAVIERRIALLHSLGEDVRNTSSWRDVVVEMREFQRSVRCRTWHLRTTTGA